MQMIDFCRVLKLTVVTRSIQNAEPLNCNVSLLDLEASNVEDLPNILMDTSNKKQAMQFMRKWKA